MQSSTSSTAMPVVICGGGIIGSATAYYLTKMGRQVVVVEQCAVACAASGKSGGFLAQSWNDGTLVGPLARRSFELHAKLSTEIGIEVGYRRVNAHSVSLEKKNRRRSSEKQKLPDWIDGSAVGQFSSLGTTANLAQVHPRLLTEAFMKKVVDGGGKLIIGTVTGLEFEGKMAVGVKLKDGTLLKASHVVLALGPWSAEAKNWLPKNSASFLSHGTPVKAHSVVLRPKKEVTGDMLFLDYQNEKRKNANPEVYPRPDGTVYVCDASNINPPLPSSANQVTIEKDEIDAIKEIATKVSSYLSDASVEAEQACYLPISSDGIPIIGKANFVGNVYLATGHSCWGILNAPATGEAVAEMIINEGKSSSTSVEMSAFAPSRFL